ncbi:MAG: Periplasmic protein-like protein [Hyphomicrobiales bacterium]|nr:Periplasmic protein-like protein [Hyphomicrobiales bacterium]
MRRAMSFLSRSSGLFALAALCGFMTPSGAGAAEMAFRLVDFGNPAKCRQSCPQVIAADGEITANTPQLFLDFIGSHIQSGRLHSIVLMNSQGGQVVGSMELGRAFRTIGAAVIVARAPAGRAVTDGSVFSGRCYSACVYALMGATTRVAPPQSRVGIHRMFMFEANRSPESTAGLSRVYAASALVTRLGDYAQVMGVNPELVWTAETIDPDKIRILSGQEMRRWKLAAPKL